MSRVIGCRDLHIAKVVSDDLTGTVYESPVRIPSLVGVDISNNSESTTFYSDDVAEQTIVNASSTEVEIKLGYMTNEVQALLTGQEYDEKTGAIYESNGAVAPEVAVLFRSPKSKGGFAYITLFKGVFSIEGSSYATQEDGIESQEISLKGVFSALQSNGRKSMRVDSDMSGAEVITSKWFESVQGVDAPVTEPSVKASK